MNTVRMPDSFPRYPGDINRDVARWLFNVPKVGSHTCTKCHRVFNGRQMISHRESCY